MTPMRFLRRLGALLRGRNVDRDMDAEMSFHLEMEAADFERSGLPPDEARRRARQTFGGVQRVRAGGRDARGVGPARALSGALRFGLRTLRRSPVFTIAAVGTVPPAVAATGAIFS